MTRDRVIVALLGAVAILLAVNIVVNLPPQEAKAQTHMRAAAGDDDDVVVGISVVGTGAGLFHILRLRSDGVVEERVAHNGGDPSGPLNWHPTIIPEWVEIE